MTNHAAPAFYVENLGCAKNQVDAETIIVALEDASCRRVEEAGEADIIIVNTCGFIEDARQESIDVTLSFRQLYPGKRIIVAGCLSQRNGSELATLLPEVDGIFGNRAPSRIGEIVDDVLDGRRRVFLPELYENAPQRDPELSTKGSAYLKVAEGCDNRCSYCSIPLIRGGLRSRPVDEVADDASRLLATGTVEINLIAQDLGSYGMDLGGAALPRLLRRLLEIPGEYWLRMLYIHPDRFPREVLDICREDPRLIPYFDIPVQHASRRLLSRMGRTGDADTYVALVETLRAEAPDAVIRTTLLAGFPGESSSDFRELLSFQRRASFDWLGAFSYSREKGTGAYLAGFIPPLAYRLKKPVVEGRVRTIREAQTPISEGRMAGFVGRELDVLIEERIKEEELYFGRIYAQAPEVDGLTVVHGDDLEEGRFCRCRIVKANGIDLEAVPL